jgi:ABC-2 type transport system permease protein
MLRLMRSELFRLRKRPQCWVMALVMVFGVIATYTSLAVAAILMSDPNEPADLIAPQRVFESGMQLVAGLGYVLTAIVAASIIGNEYSWGTIRPLVARARSRPALIWAKLLTLGAYIAGLTLLGFLMAVFCAVVASFVIGTDISFSTSLLGDWAVSLLRMLLAQLPYAALSFFVTMVARSTAVGIGVGIGIAILEPAIWSLIALATDRFEPVRRLGLDYASTTMFHINTHVQEVSAGEATRSAFTLALWTIALVAASFWIFMRRDVTND